jgi:hypothetical protein
VCFTDILERKIPDGQAGGSPLASLRTPYVALKRDGQDYLIGKRKDRGGKPWQPPPKLVLQWSVELARCGSNPGTMQNFDALVD